ncbi:MAG: tetratricopeptide repeat protein [archaeon]|nr:tetratricopeptide repeat protein [archaeon]
MLINKESKEDSFSNDNLNIFNSYVAMNYNGCKYLKESNYESAFEAFTKCHNFAVKLEDQIQIAYSLMNIGICCYFLGDYENSLEKMEKVREISTKYYEDIYSGKQIKS